MTESSSITPEDSAVAVGPLAAFGLMFGTIALPVGVVMMIQNWRQNLPLVAGSLGGVLFYSVWRKR